jgi:nucleoside-diphosphate-sugar epimerase
MKKILIFGKGRVGRALSHVLESDIVEVKNVSSRLTLPEIKLGYSEIIGSFDLIIWAGRDAGLPNSSDNSAGLFHELLEEIRKTHWCGYFVFISSAGEIYGEVENPPAKETDPVFPTSRYGNLKAKHEFLLTDLSKSISLSVLILRVSNIYEVSLNDPGIVGALLRSLLLKEKFELQGGKQTRDFIELNDLITAVEKLVSLNAVGIYNVATGHSISINDLVALSEFFTLKSISATRTRKVEGILYSSVSIAKLENLLNWKPKPIENHFAKSKEKHLF